MSHRVERINSLIRQEISELLKSQIKDPRLGGFVSINEVITSADLKHARVYVSQIGNEMEKEKVLNGLSSASGFFRKELSKNLKLRYAPELHFEWDNSIAQGDNILKILNEVIPEGEE